MPRVDEVVLHGSSLLRRADDPAAEDVTFDQPTTAAALARRLALPAPSAPRGLAELTLEGVTRRVRTVALGEDLVHRVQVPEGGRLEVGAALRGIRLSVDAEDRTARLGALPEGFRATLRIRVEDEGGGIAELWARGLGADGAGAFVDATLDLGPWAGQRVRLSFECRRAEGAEPDWAPLVSRAEPVVWAPQEDPPPDVLVLLLDTLRADRLGAYGWERARTPHLDARAARGVMFEDAMAAASWTLPSHASMFTSTYPSQHGLWNDQRLPRSTVTVAEVLRRAGYRTAAFAERGFLDPSHGLARGFDVFDSRVREYDETFAAAEEWIRRPGAPFFAFVQTYKVHAPFRPAAGFAEGHVRATDDPEPFGTITRELGEGADAEAPDPALVTHVSDLYDAEIAELDHFLGEFLTRLEDAGLLENTLLIVTSDHGEEFFEHGSFGHGSSLYQELLHVPLILYQQGRFEGGAVVERPVHGVDLAPTIAAAANAPVPGSWVGLPWTMAPPGGTAERPLFVPMRTRWTLQPERWGEPAVALRIGDLEYVDYPAGLRPLDPQAGPALYHLARDPAERADLLDAEQAALWSERAAEARRRFEPIGDAGSVTIDEERRRNLEALGYGGR